MFWISLKINQKQKIKITTKTYTAMIREEFIYELVDGIICGSNLIYIFISVILLVDARKMGMKFSFVFPDAIVGSINLFLLMSHGFILKRLVNFSVMVQCNLQTQ